MTKQFLTLGFETEHFQDWSYNCPQCSEPITNPLCHTCLGEDIKQWLSFYPDIKKKIVPQLNSYIKEVNNSISASLSCIACNKRKAALCPYCFTEGVFNILKRNNVNVHVVGDFLTVFNFDLEKAGYLAEATEEGLY